jgi:hypothetical protein
MTYLPHVTSRFAGYLLLGLLVGGSIRCRGPIDDKSPGAPALTGTYALRIDEDTLIRRGTVQLLRAQDSVVWGQLTFEPPRNLPWALRVTSQSYDSLSLNVYQRYTVRLSRSADTLRGQWTDHGQVNSVQLLRLSDTVSPTLERLNQTEVLTVRGEDGNILPRVRWSHPTASGIYLANIADAQIKFATPKGEDWQARPLPGAQTGYALTGFSLAPGGDFMVAHGSALAEDAPSYGGSDLYFLGLNEAGDSITQVTLLPAPISGASYDLFPSLRGDSVMIFCGWERSEGLGRGDLYQTKL